MRVILAGTLLALFTIGAGETRTHGAGPPRFKLSELKVKKDGTGTAILKTTAKATGGYNLHIVLRDSGGAELFKVELQDFANDDAYKNSADAWSLDGSEVKFKSKKIADFVASNPKAAKAVAQVFAGTDALTNALEVPILASK